MTRLANLQRMQQHRRIGHTTFMMSGLGFERPAVFVFASKRHAQQAMKEAIDMYKVHLDLVDFANSKVGRVYFRAMDILNDNVFHHYWGMPVQVDHLAMQELLAQHTREVERLGHINELAVLKNLIVDKKGEPLTYDELSNRMIYLTEEAGRERN